MNDSNSSNSLLAIAPLGAGDLIDRAVRLYRKNFWTFVLIAAPPVVAGTLFSIAWTMLGRAIFFVGTGYDPAEMVSYYLFTYFGGVVIWLIESVAVLTVMGGASRNFVRHLLFEEPITFRETYKNTAKRVFSLIFVSVFIAVILGIIGVMLFYFCAIVIFLIAAAALAAFSFLPFLSFIVTFVLGIAVAGGTLWLFFLIASRFAYIPQVMLVESQDVFPAIGRSMNLASGNIKRFAALFIFTVVVTYSALALLYIPLGWYAWANGVEVFFSADLVPAWYQVASQLVGQMSLILLMPVWMIGLCLLYVDERVRHEGYDIELMAARQLGEIPAVPPEFINPLQPALAKKGNKANQNYKSNRKSSTLGLE